MKELGQILRQKREALNIDLDELQARTKIRKRYLIALEDGDWAMLPGDVYARGFVRSYAESVGLDGKALLDKYFTSVQPEARQPHEVDDEPPRPTTIVRGQSVDAAAPTPPAQPAPRRNTHTRPVSAPTKNNGRRKGRNVGGEAAAVVAILVVLGGAWWLIGGRGTRDGGSNHVAAGSSAGQNLDNSASTSGQGNSTANNGLGAGTGNAANDANATGGNNAVPPQVQVVAQTFQNNRQTYIVNTTEPMSVVLATTNDNCWIKAVADGKVVDPSDTVQPGQSRTWQATQTLQIRIGNVHAVSLTVNGQPVTLPNVNYPIDVTLTKGQSQ